MKTARHGPSFGGFNMKQYKKLGIIRVGIRSAHGIFKHLSINMLATKKE